jgi:hypothetical protein
VTPYVVAPARSWTGPSFAEEQLVFSLESFGAFERHTIGRPPCIWMNPLGGFCDPLRRFGHF